MLPSSRGALFPKRLPDFHRLAPPVAAEELIEWFWITSWSLPDGSASRQNVIGYPTSNLVVEPTLVGLAGPTTRASYRDLSGRGWAVGALLKPAAVPALTPDPVSLRDRYEPIDAPGLLRRVVGVLGDEVTEETRAAAAAEVATWLTAEVGQLSADARLANGLAELAGTDPAVLRVGDLADRLGLSERGVQRLARRYIGLSPAALIRRRRLQEAAERIRNESGADLATLAVDLGYADQAHLTNEFTRVLGVTPAEYRRLN
jgi:AraC-like DNA-binding protein